MSSQSSFDEAEAARRSSLPRPRSGSHIFDEPLDYGRSGLGIGAADGRIRQLQGKVADIKLKTSKRQFRDLFLNA